MRTAEEIIYSRNPTELGERHEDFMGTMIMCINEARMEAIKECAEVAEGTEAYFEVDKQSILKLIDQVK